MIYKYVVLTLRYHVYEDQARKGGSSPSSLVLLLFGIFWNVLKL